MGNSAHEDAVGGEGTDKLVGVGNATNASFYNFVIPFINPADTTNDIWTNTASLISTYQYFSAVTEPQASAEAVAKVHEYSDVKFDKDMYFEVDASFAINGTPGVDGPAFGVCVSANLVYQDLGDDTPAAGGSGFGFRIENSTGKLFARTNQADTITDTEITGVTIANSNTYRAEFIAGSECRFYVNGVLEATITTNLPTSTVSSLKWGIGCKTATNTYYVDKITAPAFSIEK